MDLKSQPESIPWQMNKHLCVARAALLSLICIDRRRVNGEADEMFEWAKAELELTAPFVNRLWNELESAPDGNSDLIAE